MPGYVTEVTLQMGSACKVTKYAPRNLTETETYKTETYIIL